MNNTWRFKGNELKYLAEVLESGEGSATSGAITPRFEQAFCNLVDADYAIAFNSGTSTLHAALFAVGVGFGDEVIIPPLTVISNLNVILAMNAIPVFADIDPDTFNISSEEIEKKITDKTKAIMPVSLYGLSCDMEKIMDIAKRHNVPVILDAAEAYLSTCNGKNASKMADITSYSTENSKHLATGDGGMVVTDNEVYAIKMRKFGSLGYACVEAGDGRIRLKKKVFQDPFYCRHDQYSLNYRMPEVAAAVGLAQVERADLLIQKRIDIGDKYRGIAEQSSILIPQVIPSGYHHSYWTFVVKLDERIDWYEFRDKFMEMGGEGVYAAWVLLYKELIVLNGDFVRICPDLYSKDMFEQVSCPVAERLQPRLLQFATNYENLQVADKQLSALQKTICYFESILVETNLTVGFLQEEL